MSETPRPGRTLNDRGRPPPSTQPSLFQQETKLAEFTNRKGELLAVIATPDMSIRVERDGVPIRTEGPERALERMAAAERPNPSYIAFSDVVLNPDRARTMAQRFRIHQTAAGG